MAKTGGIIAALLLTVLSAVVAGNAVPDEARLVVAIRYLQPTGTSHAHLFLYTGNGKLVRQLTNASDGQDRDPVFSPDGKTIVFRRESHSKNDFWQIAVENGKSQRITLVPSWYFSVLKERPGQFDFTSGAIDANDKEIEGSSTVTENYYRAPNGTTEIVVKPRGDADATGWPREPWLKEKDKSDTRVSELPFTAFDHSGAKEENEMRYGPDKPNELDIDSAGDLDDVMVYQGSPYLWFPPLRIAILRQHRGSTDGEGYFALDLNSRTLHEIAPNSSEILIVEGVLGFFCVAHERYLPLGDGKRTVNCSFLDLWNGQLERTRFCAPKAAVFYGGCLYLPSPDRRNVTFLPGETEWQ